MPWKDLPEEIAHHLQDLYDDLRARGASDDAARRAVADELEGATFGARPMADLRGDLRYAFRTLRKHPGFAAVVMLTLCARHRRQRRDLQRRQRRRAASAAVR